MRIILSLLFCLGAAAPLLGNANGDPVAQDTTQHLAIAATGVDTSQNPKVTPITVERALALAEQNSPLLKEAEAAVSRAQAGIQTARAYSNPSVEFLAGNQSARSIATPGVPGTLWHYSASQPIEIPTERRNRISSSKLEYSGMRYRLQGTRLSVAADVKRAFYDVIWRKEQLNQAKENLSLVEDLTHRVRLEVEVGEKGKLELTRAEAEQARARVAVRSADVQLANARAILKAAIGSPSEETFDAEGLLRDSVAMQPLNELRQQVLANHPALSEANALTERTHAVVQQEQARRIPQPSVFGEYEKQPDITFYRFGISTSLPLWDRRKGPIAEAKAEVKRSEAISQQRRLEITSALERAYDQYQISNEQIEGLEAGSLREAQAAVEAARSAYKFGERGILEVLDAQRVLYGVRSDLLDAMFARRSALIDLEELGAIQR